MKTLTQVKAEQRVTLTQRIHKIIQLSIQIRGAGIAHAFIYYQGHIDGIDAKVVPVDQVYDGEADHIYLASADVSLSPYEWMDLAEVEGWFVTELAKLDQYIAYLDHIIALGKPILTKDVGGAA